MADGRTGPIVGGRRKRSVPMQELVPGCRRDGQRTTPNGRMAGVDAFVSRQRWKACSRLYATGCEAFCVLTFCEKTCIIKKSWRNFGSCCPKFRLLSRLTHGKYPS